MILLFGRCLVFSLLFVVAAGADGAPRLWFVDNSRPGGGDGSGSRPFDSLAAAQAASGAGDVIYLFRGARPYGAFALKEQQVLIGEGILGTPMLAARGMETPALAASPGPPPRIEIESGDALTLASGSAVYGVAAMSTNGRAVVIPKTTGSVIVERLPIATTSGVALAIEGGDTTITLDAVPIRATSGTAVTVKDRTGGTIDFRNGSTVVVSAGAKEGVLLTNGKGTITFADPIALKTAGATALRIAAAGKVRITSSSSILDATKAPALDVTNSDLELRFESISADGGERGVSLDRATGTLRVTGQASKPASGGTIRNIASRAVSVTGDATVTLENMLFQKNATTNAAPGLDCAKLHQSESPKCSAVLHLTGADATLTSVTIDGSSQVAIHGDRIRGLALTNVDLGGAGDEAGESAIQLRHPLGAIAIANSRIRASASRHISMYTREGQATLTLRDSKFSGTKKPHGQQGVLVDAGGNANVTVSVTGSTFEDHDSFALHILGSDNAKLAVTVEKSTFARQQSAIALQTGNSAALQYRIDQNGITYARAPAINVNASGVASGTITGNTIGESGKPGSGARCGSCSGIAMHAPKAGRFEADVTGNTIQQIDGSGIYASGGGVATMRLVIARNTIREPFGDAPLSAIMLDAATSAKDTVRLCADILDNTISGAWDPQGERAAILMMLNSTAMRVSLPGFTGRDADAAALYLRNRNRSAVAKVFTADPNVNIFEAVATCATK